MPETGPMILRNARKAAGFTLAQMEALMHVSVTTIKAWEYGDRRPESRDVARMAQIVKDDTLWPRWMCAEDDEYARRHPYAAGSLNPTEAVVNAGCQMKDVSGELTEALIRCLIARRQNPTLAQSWMKEAGEAAAALFSAIDQVKKGGST